MADRLLLREAAKVLNLTPHYLRTEARNGRIPHLKVGNRFLFIISQVEAFLSDKAMQNVKPEDVKANKILHLVNDR